ncbi:oligosaccharide repeat unit polymerase [candidate division KSB1 bacterium]|nr:oligosaccharide repeat unit polymerase [candidate division KSB1 bacterium]NIR68859.1 oligosaccharide repeat unit polymerase [candidate division KSB1 bacterium]NIS27227.1 oligosaccharide repeat unit polymerase [candidate division KSB1 bacterium]NIT74112.1 oligosaccharide repeat unit polymerase [candidate division KSB1 bacterium]NIU27961.1 oligosaccharide repeat unit polymerase [candidate division KSB1 bacterium]
MNENKILRAGQLSVFVLLVGLIVYAILDDTLVDFIISEPYYGYSILLGIISLFLALLILHKSKTFPPSIVLFFSFLVVPFIGPPGNRVYEKLYGLFHGIHLSFSYPTLVWAVGTVALLAGILFSYYLIPTGRAKKLVKWDLKRASLLAWGTVGFALFFTLFAIFKIGYIPLLSGDIDDVRTGYEAIVGDYPLKFSRLWLVAASLSSMLAFLMKPKRIYLLVVLVSCVALMIYGQRIYTFMVLVSFVLIYCKFRRPKLIYFGTFGLFIIVVFILYAEYRAGRSNSGLSVPEVVTLQLFGEWREYSLVVNDLKDSGDFYEEDIFIGALSPIFPKQIWAVFGIDKNELIEEYSAVYVFGRRFDNPLLGIRLGTIGEAYAGYGMFYGVFLQLFVFGVIFGFLEKFYLNLNKEDARLCLTCFLISLFMYLPITTLYVTMAHAIFFGFFFVVFQVFGSYHEGKASRTSDAQVSMQQA